MFGLAEFLSTWELRLIGSVALALIAFVLSYLVRRVRGRLVERYSPVLVDLLSSSLLIGIVVVTTLAIADMWEQTAALLDQLGFLQLEERTSQVVMTIVVLVAIQVLVGVATRLLDNLTTESKALTEHQREIALRSTQLTLWVGGLLVILGIWAIDLTGVLVGAGFLGIVIGLASRKTLGSLLAGFVLMFSRPFEIGDWIVVGDYKGVVSDITMMSTRLVSANGEYVVVPNDVITSETVVNRSRRGRIRIDVDVGIDYDADVESARELAAEVAGSVAADSAHVQEDPAPEVLMRQFGDSSVGLTVRAWVRPPKPRHVHAARNELVAAIKTAFDDEGIKIPYPQRELSARDEADGFRIADGTADRDATGSVVSDSGQREN